MYGESSSNARYAPDVCLSFVLLFTIFIIVVTQKLVLKQSKSVTAKCTETLLPPPCIQFSLLELKSPADRDPKVASFDVKINEHFVIFKLNLTTITLLFKNEHVTNY